MSDFGIAAVLVTLAALFSYINHRFLKLPATIGLMAMSLVLSLTLILVGEVDHSFADFARQMVGSIDFEDAFVNGMLSFLLFAGALQLSLPDLSREKKTIGLL